MKMDGPMDGPPQRVQSAKKPRLRLVDLSLEAVDLTRRGEPDNGKFPLGVYKKSKKSPPGLHAHDKSRDFHRQLGDDIDRLLDADLSEGHRSPTWAVEAHRQPTHSGESPLLTNKYLASSKHEPINGTSKWNKESQNPRRCSAPPVYQGTLYYRPIRAHQYLSATELRDAAENDVIIKYGRPTRTTLLRARQRSKTAACNAYELRRELIHRIEEIKNSSIFSNPKDFVPHHTAVDGEPFHSFLMGARYNRAHCLDARSLTQFGVYMPRSNPLAWFVLEQRLADMGDSSPDSPRSVADEGPPPTAAPTRPTTAPGYGRRVGPSVPSTPRPAWGDASTSMHIIGADTSDKKNDDGREPPAVEEIVKGPQGYRSKGSRLTLSSSRGDNNKYEGKLPSVQGTSLSKIYKVQETADDNACDSQQPPPSPVVTSFKADSALPAVKPEVEADRKSQGEQPKTDSDLRVTSPPKRKPTLVDRAVNVPSVVGSHLSAEDAGKAEDNRNEADRLRREAGGDVPDDKTAIADAERKAGDDEREDRNEDDVRTATDGASMEARASSSLRTSGPSMTTPSLERPTDDISEPTINNDNDDMGTADTPRNCTVRQDQETTSEGDDGQVKGQEGEVVEGSTFFVTQHGPGHEGAEDVTAVVADVRGDKDSNTSPLPADHASDTGSGSSRERSGSSRERGQGKKSVTFSDMEARDAPTLGVRETPRLPKKADDNDVTSDLRQGQRDEVDDVEENEVDDLEPGLMDGEPLKVIVIHKDSNSLKESPLAGREGELAERREDAIGPVNRQHNTDDRGQS